MGFGVVVLLPLFILGGVGAGDVKLLSGIGSWVGFHDVVAIFLVFGTLMGLYSAFVLVGERHREVSHRTGFPIPFSTERIEQVVAQDPSQRRRSIVPMAPFMAIAIVMLALWAIA
jgi:Flp pilus assembly protein protease CpaA